MPIKTKQPRPRTVRMKAYQIGEYYIAAFNDYQAIGTLAAHLEEEDPEKLGLGPCTLVDPAKITVHFEKDRGGYEKGELADIMPAGDAPEVLIDPDYP